MFSMTTHQLLAIYCYIVNIVVLGLSFWFNYSFIIEIKQDDEDVLAETRLTFDQHIYKHVFAQLSFACIVYLAWNYRHDNNDYIHLGKFFVQAVLHLSFLSPAFMIFFFKQNPLICWSPLLGLVFPLLHLAQDIIESLGGVYDFMCDTYIKIKLTVLEIGIQAVAEHHWMRLNVPQVLRVFYLTRILYQVLFHFIFTYFNRPQQINEQEANVFENTTVVVQNLLVRSCETFVSLLAMTSIVSYIANYIGLFMALWVGVDTEDHNMGTVAAILFFLLALQTGLTGLEPEKRLVRMYRNFALLSAAILHFVHSMVHPLLLSLSASQTSSLNKHIRVLTMCAFLIIYPVCLLTYLWGHHSASPWLLAVTAFSIEVVIKVLVSLTVYTLFIIDACQQTFWEKLDDYIYYVQSTGNTIEFLFGIFMFCNGGWIMIFESGGAIRAVMMCIHAYLNIFIQAKEGWKIFKRRRMAAKKINSLREASAEELRNFNDVCAICYQELKSAQVTRCNHYYHSVCLRKWLYIQDNCPLCHEVLYVPPKNADMSGKL